MTPWQWAKPQMEQDLSYLFNKETICNFQFPLKHDYKWWVKFRKNMLIGVFVSFVLCMIIGLIICLLQIWWDKSHPITIYSTYGFVWGGIIFWCCCAFIYAIIFFLQTNYMTKQIMQLFPYFKQGVLQGYLSNDENKYPQVIQSIFYANNSMGPMVRGSSGFRNAMSLYGLVAIMSQVKEYQSKYCSVNHNNGNNA